MKKGIALLLALCSLLAFSACGTEKPVEPATTGGTQTEPTTQPKPENTEPELKEVKLLTSVAYLSEFDSEVSQEERYEWEEDHLRLNCYSEDVPLWSHVLYGDEMKLNWEYWYDEEGNCSEGYEYSPDGLDKSQIFYLEDGSQIEYEYDEQGQPLSATAVDAEGNSKLKELWIYDDNGLLLEHLEYDVERSNEIATFEVTVCNSWKYDQFGQPLQHAEYEADRLVSLESWVYDAQGNVLENHIWRDYGDEESSSNTVNTYDEAGQLVSCVCDGEDAISDWNYRSAFTYDDAGNLIEETTTHESGETFTNTWSYDHEGKLLKSVTYYNMDGWVTCLTENIYDEKGQLTEEGYHEFYENELLTGYNSFYTYDEAGNLVEKTYADVGATPLRTVYKYDAKGTCIGVTKYEGEDVVSLIQWTYDETGKLLDVRTGDLESLAAYGDEVRMITHEDGENVYVAIKYKTLRVDEDYAKEIEAKNAYVLSLLDPQNS